MGEMKEKKERKDLLTDLSTSYPQALNKVAFGIIHTFNTFITILELKRKKKEKAYINARIYELIEQGLNGNRSYYSIAGDIMPLMERLSRIEIPTLK